MPRTKEIVSEKKIEDVASNIKKRRRQLRMTQAELGKEIGVTQQRIAMFEKGDAIPDIFQMQSIADALHTTLEILLSLATEEIMNNENIVNDQSTILRKPKLNREHFNKNFAYMEVLNMITTKYPNRDAIYKAYTIYRDAMRRFIIESLEKNHNRSLEDLIKEVAPDDLKLAREIHNEIEAAIDIQNFPAFIRKYWESNAFFSKKFNNRKAIWNEAEVIKDGRIHWAHPGTKDTKRDTTLKLLFHISDVLDKINASDEKHEVKTILDELSYDNREERLEVMSNELETAQTKVTMLEEQLVASEKRLAIIETEKIIAEEQLADMSNIVVGSFPEPSDERKTADTSDKQPKFEPTQELSEAFSRLKVGQWVNGKVKSTARFGAFVDLGGVEGLIRIPELTWKLINRPEDIVSIGDEVRVKIINIDQETEKGKTRIDLRLKPNPWEDSDVEDKYPIGSVVSGIVTSITDYGVFLNLEEGITGMIHKSELSWQPNGIIPSNFNQDDEINAVVLEVSKSDKRISLGYKYLQQNPWKLLEQKYPVGTKITGPIINVTTFGVFVEIEPGINGLIRMSPPESLMEGDEIETIISDINVEKQQITLYLSTVVDSGKRF